MKPQAHYEPKSKKWIISFVIMAVITFAVAFGSTAACDAMGVDGASASQSTSQTAVQE